MISNVRDQRGLPADPVAVVAEDRRADRPGGEADELRAEGGEHARRTGSAPGRTAGGTPARRRCRRGRSRTTRWWCRLCWRRRHGVAAIGPATVPAWPWSWRSPGPVCICRFGPRRVRLTAASRTLELGDDHPNGPMSTALVRMFRNAPSVRRSAGLPGRRPGNPTGGPDLTTEVLAVSEQPESARDAARDPEKAARSYSDSALRRADIAEPRRGSGGHRPGRQHGHRGA